MDGGTKIDPRRSAGEWQELASIDYFLARLESMRARDLISSDAYDRVVAETAARREEIDRAGRYRQAMATATSRMGWSAGDALRWAERARALDPGQPEAWRMVCDLLDRLGRSDEAAALWTQATERFPEFKTRLQPLNRGGEAKAPAPRLATAEVLGRREVPGVATAPTEAVADTPPPGPPALTWSSIAGEFLQEHWQKLILCLAVLLIVVSSTVGAHLVLGPKLWSPVGKCALAVVYTVMFATFGVGLMRWGAERAGQMMLVTTLVVVPVNFMLAGEMRLLIAPSPSRMVVLALDVGALFFVAYRVALALGWRRGALFLAGSLIALSAGDAATAQGVPLSFGLPAFLIPPWIFLGAVGWLNTRYPGERDEAHRDFVYLALGLLTFAFLSGALRTAVVLELAPALFAVPVMFTAIALAHTAHHLTGLEKDPQRVMLLRFGGLVLSALAFALALSRPPGSSALFSANTTLTALLGLALYGASLRAYRQPAYLYLAFGASFLAYFGAFYFLRDQIRAVEVAVKVALGYHRPKLPLPFKAINGLAFNVVLGLLALRFSRRWRDERLARHCHLLGIPFSIAACVLSGFEPKAAVLCLSGYALLYTIAVPLFRQPLLEYLACAALTGALAFGSMLVPGATLAVRSLGGVLLGFAFWATSVVLSRRAVERPYRSPLIHAALGLAVAGMIGAGTSALSGGPVGLAATAALGLAALLCGLLVIDLPYAPLAHLTGAGSLGAGLCLFAVVTGSGVRSPVPYGVLTALLAALWPALCAWPSKLCSPRSVVFAAAVPDTVAGFVFLAVLLVAGGLRSRDPAVAAALALGATGLVGATGFRRTPALLANGLGFAVASALVLGSWWFGWADAGAGLGGLALTAAASALLLWCAGFAIRRAGGDEFYDVPCFRAALVVTAIAFGLALDARAVSRTAFPSAAVALLVDALVCALLATTWRSPAMTFAALGSVVSATYLALFSTPHPDPEKAYVLGLVAVVEALVFWTLGMLCRRSAREDAELVFGTPLLVSSLVMTLLAIPPGLASPVTMTLVAVAFVLMVKSFPATLWLYAAIGSLAWAIDDAFLKGLPRERSMEWAVAGAFVLWLVGVVVGRTRLDLCRRLGLLDRPYESPFFNTAVVAAIAAGWMRLDLGLWHGVAWTAYAGVPVALAVFCLLMVKPYPGTIWIHGFAGLASLGLAMAAGTSIVSTGGWLVAGMVLALAWLFLGRDLVYVEPIVAERLGLEQVGAGAVLESWSKRIAVLVAIPTTVVVVTATLAAVFLGTVPEPLHGTAEAMSVGVALLLIGAYLLAQADWIGEDREIALYEVQTMLVWWVGVSWFLAGHGISPQVFDPTATAALALAIFLVGAKGEIGVSVSARRVASAEGFSFALAVVASAFTRGEPTLPTVITLLLATAVLGLQAVSRHRVASAYAAGLSWSMACVCLALRLAGVSTVFTSYPDALLATALGWTSAWLTLGLVAAWLRRSRFGLKDPVAGARDRVVLAIEHLALFGSLAATAAAAWMGLGSPAGGDLPRLAGVGVIMAAAVLHVVLARRWESEGLVYLAQVTLLGAYLDYRHAYPLPVATDAAVLTFFGYLDLGIAEVMQRLRMKVFARPTLYVSLVLPLLPVAAVLVDGRLDDLSLFLLFSTAAFYAVACYTRQWKSLGYAAAVLLNAVLWIAWSRVGWRLTDHPQFFLIPVGFSALLFAEVNRRELGNETVNAIRLIGLMVIYLSLAMPVWQFKSFGAWLTLLLLSLAGILVGIGLRVQTFLWLGLIGFVLDVVYQLGRMGAEHALARWGIMLGLGILLILFVALNEKKRIVAVMRQCYDQARQWE